MLTAITTLAAVALALLGAFWLPDEATRWQGGIAFALAAVAGVYSFRRIDLAWPRSEPLPEAGPQRARRTQVIGAAVALGGLGLIVWALLDIWSDQFVWDMAWRWAGGLILLVIAAYLIGQLDLRRSPTVESPLESTPSVESEQTSPQPVIGPRPSGYKLRAIGLETDIDDEDEKTSSNSLAKTSVTPAPPEGGFLRSKWVEAILLIAIIVAAIFFRVYKLDSVPPGIFVDETNAALDALRILEGHPIDFFGTGWFETPNGFVYLQSIFFRLFGTTVFAIKVQSLLPGILTVLALYFLGREMFGVRPALFATAFLAFNRWHLNMSRWGWNEVYPPLMQVLALFLIMRAARRRHWGDWALAGLALGLGMYTYLAIRLVALGIALYLLYRILVQRGFFRRNWQGMIVFAVVYAATFAPLAITYYQNPFTFLNRSQQVSIQADIKATGGSLEPLVESAKRHVLMFHVQGDGNARHNLPGEPMLDPITGAFFLLGFAWAIWRWRSHKYGMLIIWIVITLLGGILSQLNESPQAYRTLAVAPAIALLAADVYDLSLRGFVFPLRQKAWWRWLWLGIAALGLLAAGRLNFDTYFNRQAEDHSVYIGFSPLETAVAGEVLAKRDDHKLYLSPRLYYFSPLRFLAYEPSKPFGIDLGPISYSPFARLGGGLAQPGYQLADPALDLPLPDLNGDNASFLLDTHFEYLLEYFRYFYPGTTSELVTDRYGQPFYLSVTIPGDEISALQARNRADSAAEIKGLYIPASGHYALSTASVASATLDGKPLDGTARFLGRGLHALEVSDLPAGLASDEPILFWEAPTGYGPAPDSALFRLPPSGRGLTGVYYAGEDWQPPVLMEQIDPYLLTAWPEPEPIFGSFSATWTGSLLAPVDGTYSFRLDADDGVRFWLDDRLVGESLNPDTVNQVSAVVELTAGPHPIRIDYFQRGGGKSLEFFWAPPGQSLQPVAPSYLQPQK
ncbi:MAG: glycosyltransferase family 39 protein [Caldilineales bacterium]|nr:glycosyltransferase family 39 protein [Caldilineales bacterium]